MKRVVLPLISALIFITSCGPSAQEIADQQRHHDDSVAQVTAMKVEQKHKIQEQLSKFKTKLQEVIAEQNVANDKMSRIKEFHLLRTGAERDQQIRDEEMYIQKLMDAKEELSKGIDELESQLSRLD